MGCTPQVLHSKMPAGQAPTALWMIGDNPLTDIAGANAAGAPWRSALVRTGMFLGDGNDRDNPGTVAVDDVAAAVQHILRDPFGQ